MRLTFLGTGSAMPDGERVQTGHLVEGGAHPLLVDCGAGVLHRLGGADVDYADVHTVLLTHHHLDHVSDLLGLVTARWLAGEPETRVVGPPGTAALVEDLLGVFDYLGDEVRVPVTEVDAGEGPFEVAGWSVRAHATEHSVYTLAYRLADRLTFGADSEAVGHLVEFAAGSSALVHDCSFPDDVDVDNHPTASQVGEVLAGADVGTVYLTHLYPMTRGRHEELLEAVRSRYDGEVRIAADGLTVEVDAPSGGAGGD